MDDATSLRRFYWLAVKGIVPAMKDSHERIVGVFALLAALALLFSPGLSERIEGLPSVSPWWSAFIVGVYGAHLWMKSLHRLLVMKEKQLIALIPPLEFSHLLRARWEEMERIIPLGNEKPFLQKASKQLEDQQTLTIQLLRRPNSHWKFAPDGWSQSYAVPPLFVWAGLSAVMEKRYSDELTPMCSLYDGIERTPPGPWIARITPENVPPVKSHSRQCLALIVREIEHPEMARRTEPPALFANTIAAFSPPTPRTQGSSP